MLVLFFLFVYKGVNKTYIFYIFQTPGKLAPYIDEFSPGVTLVTGGCGNGAMCSDEIGRLGAKLATTGNWDCSKFPREKTRIIWRKIEGQHSDVNEDKE